MPSETSASDRAAATGWTAYLAADGFLDELREELGPTVATHGRLIIAEGPPRPAAWAENIWYDPLTIEIASIGEAAKALRNIQRNWALYDFQLHRRARLIQDRLPSVSAKPLVFPQAAPSAPLGSWTLLDEHTVLAAARCASPFPQWRGEFYRGQGRSAEPRLSQAVGGTDAHRPHAGTG